LNTTLSNLQVLQTSNPCALGDTMLASYHLFACAVNLFLFSQKIFFVIVVVIVVVVIVARARAQAQAQVKAPLLCVMCFVSLLLFVSP
jgi:ABC-type siderophore export system fused ATPase/permease subunit